MKQKLLNLLAIFVAFLSAIPIANADVAINEPTCIWNKTFSTPGVNSYQPIVLSNGKLVVTDVVENLSGMDIKKQYIIDQDGVVEKSAAYETVSTGLAIDDTGNAVYAHYDTQVTANNTFNLRIWQDDNLYANSQIGINKITVPSGAFSSYTFYFEASGDLDSGTGYIWFPNAIVKNGNSKYYTVRRFKIVNGVYDSYTDFDLGFEYNTQRCVIQTYYTDTTNDKHKFLFQVQGGDCYDCTLENGKVTSTKITGYPVARTNTNTVANNIFEIAGNKILVYNTGANGMLSNQIVVWDMTTGAYFKIDPFETKTSVATAKTSYIGAWVNSLTVSDTQKDIFIYSPGVGAARYSITATANTAPVSNLKAEIVREQVMKLRFHGKLLLLVQQQNTLLVIQ